MSNIKMIFRFVLGFITFVLVTILSIIIILKSTLFNKNYIIQKLDDNKYYEKLTKEITNDMSYSMLSSGVDRDIIADIITENEVKNEVNNMLQSIYAGSKYEVNTGEISARLKSKIEEYAQKNGKKITDENSFENLISNVVDIYKKQINLYGYFDGFANKVVNINELLSIVIVIVVLLIVINLLIIRYLFHGRFLGVTLFSSGMALCFLKVFVLEKIDVDNLEIITQSFSLMLKIIMKDISNILLMSVFILLLFGVVITIFSSFKKIKRIKK